MKSEDFDKIKETIDNSTSKIRELYSRIVSNVNFKIDEEIYEGMIYRIIYGAAVNSGYITQKEDKTEEKRQQANIFYLLHQELAKKKYSKLNLEDLLEQDIVDNKIVVDSRLHLIWKATQAEKKYIPPIALPIYTKQVNTKLMNVITSNPKQILETPPDTDPTQPIRTSRKGARQTFTDKVEAAIVQGSTTQSLFDYNLFGEYEGAVYDAIGTLTEIWDGQGEFILRYASIIEEMSKTKKKATDEQRARLDNAILNWSLIKFVNLDFSETAAMLKIKEGQFVYRDVYALNCERITVNDKGNLVDCVKLYAKPVLYEQAKTLKYLITLKNNVYTITDDTGKPVTDTEMRIAIKRYLVKRVEQYKASLDNANKRLKYHETIQKKKDAEPVKDLDDFMGSNKNSNTILMESIFEIAKVAADAKDVKTDIKKYVETVFKYWEKIGYVKEATRREKGRSFDAIVFKVNKKKSTQENEAEQQEEVSENEQPS